jgi:hypothetical protein
MMAAGLLVAWIAGASSASTLRDRAAMLASQDHEVTATVTPSNSQGMGRTGVQAAVATWIYPAGVKHSEAVTESVVSPEGYQRVWVDPSGLPTAGPPSPLTIAGGVALTAVRTLLMTALAILAVTVAIQMWRRHQLQTAVDAHWRSLAHHLWEDL